MKNNHAQFSDFAQKIKQNLGKIMKTSSEKHVCFTDESRPVHTESHAGAPR